MVTLPTNFGWSGLLLEMRLSCTWVSFLRNARFPLSKAIYVRITRSSLKSVLPAWGLYLAVSMLTFWLLVRHCTEKRQGKRTAVVAERTESWIATENADLSGLVKFMLYWESKRYYSSNEGSFSQMWTQNSHCHCSCSETVVLKLVQYNSMKGKDFKKEDYVLLAKLAQQTERY